MTSLIASSPSFESPPDDLRWDQGPCKPRFSTPRTNRRTLGPQVGKIAAALGTPLMPWQQHVVDVAMEVDENDRLVYREIVLTVPRQSGKSTLLLAIAIHRALAFAERQNITYAAQSGVMARDKMLDEWAPTLERSPVAPLVDVRRTNGHEAFLFENGSKWDLTANTATSGHGATLDLAFIDEAFAQVDNRLEQAFKPAMVTRDQPQLWIVSTAGTAESTYLKGKVDNGREMAQRYATQGVAYFEWSSSSGDDPGSVETWQACMPALGHTITLDAIASDYASMELGEFLRAYLNRWLLGRADPVIAATDWSTCFDQASKAEDPVALAVDVTPDRAYSAIGVAGDVVHGDAEHVEVVEHRSGTSWVVPRMVELAERHRPSIVVLDAAGPAGSLLEPLQTALEPLGVEVRVISTREATQACGAFYDAAKEHALRHIGQSVLTAAVDGADRRAVGDAWLWSRKSSSVDISPLVAVTLALWGHAQTDLSDPALGVY